MEHRRNERNRLDSFVEAIYLIKELSYIISDKMAEEEGNPTSFSEPLDLVRLSLDEIVFVKLRGDRELKGRLHVSWGNVTHLLSKAHDTDVCDVNRHMTVTAI